MGTGDEKRLSVLFGVWMGSDVVFEYLSLPLIQTAFAITFAYTIENRD